MHRAWAMAALMISGSALAQGATEIFKCVDGTGRPLYTSDKRDTVGKKCEVVSREINVVPSRRASPGGFPRETPTQKMSARERQREILQKELATEQEALAKARQALAQQESVRSGDERNYARVLERLQPYKESVENHEKNIQALQRELANLAR
jgi:chromosome segregation ATPase